MTSATGSGLYQGEFRHLVDVALHKTASQSSLSLWSQPSEAGNAISGRMPQDFAFHTAEEVDPWWLVDLAAVYPLEVIVISNRKEILRERASTLRVEASSDGSTWTLLHAGLSVFGTRLTGDPFTLWLRGAVTARYVRLSLAARQCLHLCQVEVFAKSEQVAFTEYCAVGGLATLQANNAQLARPYTVSGPDNGIIGLDVSYSARFGNLLIQYINAIVLAKKTGLKYVRLGYHPLLAVEKGFEAQGLQFVSSKEALPQGGRFLTGDFFVSDVFVPVLMPFLRFTPDDERTFTGITQDVIRPYMLTGIPLSDEEHPEDEVTVHLRSGDVFAPYTPVVRGYRQPPLSFYKLVITHLRDRHGVRRARLVFEDRGNPCVDALEAWLEERRVPVRMQSGSLHQDMSALVDAPHLVLGHGTFGYAACRLSKKIRTLHYFEPELGGAYGCIGSIDRVFSVADKESRYFKAFEFGKPFAADQGWFNTPEERNCMLTYPIDALAMKELPSSMRRVGPV